MILPILMIFLSSVCTIDAMSGDLLEEEFLAAARSGTLLQIEKCLQNGVNPNCADAKGMTAIEISSHHERLECVDRLLQCPDITIPADSSIITQLCAPTYRYLKDNNPVDVCEILALIENAPLRLSLVKKLLQKKAPIGRKNVFGSADLELAILNANTPGLIVMLIEYGAQFPLEQISTEEFLAKYSPFEQYQMRKKRPDLHIDTTQYRKNLLIYAVDTHQSFKIKEVLSSQDIQLHHIHEALRHSKKKFASKQSQKNQKVQQEHLSLIKNSAQIIKNYYSVMEGLGFVQPSFPFWGTSKKYTGILTSQIARKIAYIAALDQKCSGC